MVFDVNAGLVTPEGARRYGVVIKADGSADPAATEKLRAKLRAARKEVKLFDRGFKTIEELKGRCLAETGHPAPAQPVFTNWAQKRIANDAAAVKGKAKGKPKAKA